MISNWPATDAAQVLLCHQGSFESSDGGLRGCATDPAYYAATCASLRPEPDMCGTTQAHALRFLERLEVLTAPDCRF